MIPAAVSASGAGLSPGSGSIISMASSCGFHTLHEGVQDDFGSISIVLALLWALFTAMLLISWLVIRRMVSNMYTLQHSLQWQAWHDPLTRLNNRGALFDRAKLLAETCRQQSLPFSVIQIDLDYFKTSTTVLAIRPVIRCFPIRQA